MDEQDHIITTFSEMASRYEKLMNHELKRFWGIDYFNFIHEVLKDIKIDSSFTVLDIATGTAFIPRYLIKQGISPSVITGLDITYKMLTEGRMKIDQDNRENIINLVCASAQEMPFKRDYFDLSICCLATHHMHVELLLEEIYFSLKPGGKFHIGDVGGSSKWKVGLVRTLIKILAFLYFFFAENFSRAKAESSAVANVMTSDEWLEKIHTAGFRNVEIREIQSGHFWVPNPVIIQATK